MWTKATPSNEGYLAHYGIRGQKWGQRNYQRTDGSLTPAGVERYRDSSQSSSGRKVGSLKRRGEGLGTGKVSGKFGTDSRPIKDSPSSSSGPSKPITLDSKPKNVTSQFYTGRSDYEYVDSSGNTTGVYGGGYIYINDNGTSTDFDPDVFDVNDPDDVKAMQNISHIWATVGQKSMEAIAKADAAKNPIVRQAQTAKAVGLLATALAGRLGNIAIKSAKNGAQKIGSGLKSLFSNFAKHSSESEEAIKTDWVKTSDKDELTHWGVPGMRWGHRRYQNTDGSLTTLGEIHYGVGSRKERRSAERAYIKTKEAEDRAYVKKMKSDQKATKKISDYEAKAKRDAEKAAKRQEEEDLRAKRKREKRVNKEIEKEEREAQKKAEAEKKAEDKETRRKLEEENAQKAKEAKDAEKKEQAEQKQEAKEAKAEQKAEQKQAKQEAKEAKKKEAENAKREEQIKNDTEKVQEAMKEKPQNEEPMKERKPISADDYKDVGSALKRTSENLGSMKDLVNVIEGARQRNAVRNAVGERKLSKPISEMSDQEINATVNRWAAEDRIAQASVGARSKAADSITTALDVVGNLTMQSSRAFGIASNIRSIVERR